MWRRIFNTYGNIDYSVDVTAIEYDFFDPHPVLIFKVLEHPVKNDFKLSFFLFDFMNGPLHSSILR